VRAARTFRRAHSRQTYHAVAGTLPNGLIPRGNSSTRRCGGNGGAGGDGGERHREKPSPDRARKARTAFDRRGFVGLPTHRSPAFPNAGLPGRAKREEPRRHQGHKGRKGGRRIEPRNTRRDTKSEKGTERNGVDERIVEQSRLPFSESRDCDSENIVSDGRRPQSSDRCFLHSAVGNASARSALVCRVIR
jgi:hypothetical protein